MEELMIKVENVSKQYKLGQIGGTTLRDELQRFNAKLKGKEDPTRRLGAKDYNKGETFMALDGLSFEVKKGERVGIIGHNGAGKSTLLKLISRVTAPTSGEIGMNGRVASMLEVGTGFHAELTGRENIYMNGAILGMTKKEIDAKMEDIIEFSECRQFIDTPVKRYSSGMYVKLAFSVAAHLDSEIMIMDEVLAVGDVAFQKKCLEKMSNISNENGRTILYVSHNMNTIRQLCNRVIVLSHGEIIFDGDTEEAIDVYLNQDRMMDDVPYYDISTKIRPKYSHNKVRMNYIKMDGKSNNVFVRGETIHFELGWTSYMSLRDICIQIILSYNSYGVGTAFSIPFAYTENNESNITTFDFCTDLLAEGTYKMTIALYNHDVLQGSQYHLDFVTDACRFQIIADVQDGQYINWGNHSWGSVEFPNINAKNRKEQ